MYFLSQRSLVNKLSGRWLANINQQQTFQVTFPINWDVVIYDAFVWRTQIAKKLTFAYVEVFNQFYIWMFRVKKIISQPWLVQKPSSLDQIYILLLRFCSCAYIGVCWCSMQSVICGPSSLLTAIDLTNPYFRHKQKGTTSNLAKTQKSE